MTRSSANKQAPSWMSKDPEPQLVDKRFYLTDLKVWEGKAKLSSIQGWIGNPRTEMQANKFKEKWGRLPSNDEMYKIVLADDDPKEGLKIRELAGSIYKNGVRVPIVMTFDGKLLDGNRRYYASMFNQVEAAPATERKRFAEIPVLVLPEGTDEDTQQLIITEFNIADDYRQEWPYYVRAMRVYDDYVADLTKDDLVRKYAQKWDVLKNWIKAAELYERFKDHHGGSYAAENFAYNNFIMFDEAQRNYGKEFSKEPFRTAVFDILLDGYEDDNHRFRASKDVVRLDEIYQNEAAWKALVASKGPRALQDALTELNVAGLDAGQDPNPKLRRIVSALDRLHAAGNANGADQALLEQFHAKAEQVPGSPSDPHAQVSKMIEWLDSMTSREIAGLGAATLSALQDALERVQKMATAVAGRKGRAEKAA